MENKSMPIDSISDLDFERIDHCINTYVKHQYYSPRADLNYILRFWNHGKENLFHMFGDNLILEKEICIEKDADCYKAQCKDVFYNSTFFGKIENIIYAIYRNNVKLGDKESERIELTKRDLYLHTFYIMKDSLRQGDMYCPNNYYDDRNLIFPLDMRGEKTFEVLPGMKIMKFFSKITSAFKDEVEGLSEAFEKTRIEYSRVLNDKKLKGTLCLSIHPLDYMTMSMNAENWDSCMNWSDGCYKAGTVEMMNSPYVVVAYLKSDKNMVQIGMENKRCTHEEELVSNNYWNSKRWRKLFIVDNDVITGVKEYPYQSNALTKCCEDWLVELASSYFKCKYIDEECFDDSSFTVHMECGGNRLHVGVTFVTGLMYNDFQNTYRNNRLFLNSRFRESIWQTTLPEVVSSDGYEEIYMNYSGVSECMWCGEEIYVDDYEAPGGLEQYLSCAECMEATYCDCGHLSDNDDDVFWIDGQSYCYNCYEETYKFEDPIDEEIHLEENSIEAILGFKFKEKATGKEFIISPIGRDPWSSDENSSMTNSINLYEGHFDNYGNILDEYLWEDFLADGAQYSFEVFRGGWHNSLLIDPRDLTDEGICSIFGVCDRNSMMENLYEDFYTMRERAKEYSIKTVDEWLDNFGIYNRFHLPNIRRFKQ